MAVRTTLFTILLALCTLIGTAPGISHAAGSSSAPSSLPTPAPQLTPEERSIKAFNAGIKQRDRGLKQEAKVANAKSEKAAQRAQKRAAKAFAKAVEKQSEALRLDPQNYRAANELGYALRKTGDFRKAVGAYNFALKINPKYHAATEYRAAAFLALGLLEETQRSYMVLFREDRALADQLMTELQAWVAALDNPSASEQAFATWVTERAQIAEQSTALSWHTPSATQWPSAPGS